MDSKINLQAQMLANRLQKRFRHLHKWAKRLNIGAFRLYDRDIPEIPLVLDKYGDVISGALYKRPYEKDPEEEAVWLSAMQAAIARSLNIERDNIIIKQRERQYGQAQYEKIAEQSVTRIVSEGNLQFKVNLSDYLDTGLFLDRRPLRRKVSACSAGKRVLNLFCYTGSFSVAAAAGGAVSVDSVDLSNTYLNWARENFTLNGFEAGDKSIHRFIRADVSAFLRQAAESSLKWDLIIIDPPAFSNSTMAADFDLNRDYVTLLTSCLALLNPTGTIWFSASTRSFKADAAELESVLKGHSPGISISDISGKTVDEDFKGKKTPKSFLLNHQKFINELS